MGFLKAFIWTLKAVLAKKEFSRKLLAYGYAVCRTRVMDKDKDGNWLGELPGIYELDDLTGRLNDERETVNRMFGLRMAEWNRDEVRALMLTFDELHEGLCRVNGRRLTVPEGAEKILTSMNQPFWRIFRLNLELAREGRT